MRILIRRIGVFLKLCYRVALSFFHATTAIDKIVIPMNALVCGCGQSTLHSLIGSTHLLLTLIRDVAERLFH